MQSAMAVDSGNGFKGKLAIPDGMADEALTALPGLPGYGTGRRAKSNAVGKTLLIELLPCERSAYFPGAAGYDPLVHRRKGETKQNAANAVEELPEKDGVVMTLYYFENPTVKEVAVTHGVAEAEVSQIHLAVLRLQSALADLRPKSLPRPSGASERDGRASLAAA